jgi:hypothetical protein
MNDHEDPPVSGGYRGLGDPKLDALLAEVRRRMAELSPAQLRALARESAVSFVYGNLRLSNRDVTREQVEAAYDAGHGG